MGDLGVHRTLLGPDIGFFNLLPVVYQLGLSRELWLDRTDWVLRIGVDDASVVIGVHHDSSLGQDAVLTLSTSSLNVPHELFFITL
jgi:hypothetical protein